MKSDEKELEKIIEHIHSGFPEDQFMPVETFLHVVRPQVTKKSIRLRNARKKKSEVLCVLGAYLIAMIILPCLLIDSSVNGFSGMTGKYFLLILGFGLIMAFCIPLMVYFLKNSAKGMN